MSGHGSLVAVYAPVGSCHALDVDINIYHLHPPLGTHHLHRTGFPKRKAPFMLADAVKIEENNIDTKM